ncbi:hypothetical protein [Aggregatibacter kilianii]|nr:hypothetical protein [Aggregatibacter kilianii]
MFATVAVDCALLAAVDAALAVLLATTAVDCAVLAAVIPCCAMV